MVHIVQIMSDGEQRRYNKWQNDLDGVYDRIKLCICWSICIFIFVYLIVLIIVLVMEFREGNIYHTGGNNFIEDGSLN
jgi:hypothetical protein